MKVELKILHEDCYPDYATPGSAGVDLKAASIGNSNVGLIEISISFSILCIMIVGTMLVVVFICDIAWIYLEDFKIEMLNKNGITLTMGAVWN